MKDRVAGMSASPRPKTDWLPTSVKELQARAISELDVILFSGDAYVDHPSFAAAAVGRLLESCGLQVAIVPQPNWRDDLRDFRKLGQPRLFFAVTAGSMDSMVNHYTANRRLRSDDAYTAGGSAGARPDYAVTVYSRILKQLWPDVPLVIGGIEASLRRIAHYDYWSNSLKPSILHDSGADLLIYGMGEQPLREMVRLLKRGVPFRQLRTLRQTAFLAEEPADIPLVKSFVDRQLDSYAACVQEPQRYAEVFRIFEEESNKADAHRLFQAQGDAAYPSIVVNPPFPVASTSEIDSFYDLPFTRLPHPRYAGKTIPAYEMIRHSITLHRGCWGGCSFCTISAHQGRHIASRSAASVLREAQNITQMPDFRGQLSDVGGPSANMWQMGPSNSAACAVCQRPSCMWPSLCPNLKIDHAPLIELYAKIKQIKGIRKLVVSSGVRYDMLYDRAGQLTPDGESYARVLVRDHVSGRLKVAPEHSDPQTLELMRKPGFDLFRSFKQWFDRFNEQSGLQQELIPYFISSHPGCGTEAMAELAVASKELGYRLEQVQDLTPTPLTLTSAIWYSGIHPWTKQKVSVERDAEAKRKQKLFFFWYKNENRALISQILRSIGRDDLAQRLFAAGKE